MTLIVVVSSDTRLTTQIQHILDSEGHQMLTANSRQTAMQVIRHNPNAVVLLDNCPPDLEPDSICRELRHHDRYVSLPILALMESPTPETITKMVDSGVDDMIAKPIVPPILAARIRALVRRRQPRRATTITFNRANQSVEIEGREIALTRIEYDLLMLLSETRSAYLSADALLQKLWNYPPGAGDVALVRNHIRNLRLKVEADPHYPNLVISHHGRGYALAVDYVRSVS